MCRDCADGLYDSETGEVKRRVLNVEMLLRELRFITIHPEKWDQGQWASSKNDRNERPSACGTVGCIAGNTVVHQGYELDWYRVVSEDDDICESGAWQADYAFVEGDDGVRNREFISYLAGKELGLDGYERSVMFSSDNDLDRMWKLAIDISKGLITESDYATAKAERDVVAYAEREGLTYESV